MDGNYPYGYGPDGNVPMNNQGYGPETGYYNAPMNQGYGAPVDQGFNPGMDYNAYQNGPANNGGMGYDSMGGIQPVPDYGYDPMSGGMQMNNLPVNNIPMNNPLGYAAPQQASYAAPVYQQASPFYQPEPMPVSGFKSPLVLTLAIMSSLAFLFSLISSIMYAADGFYYTGWTVMFQFFITLSYLPMVLEGWITWGSAKKREIAATGGITVGIVAGCFHIVLSFIVASVYLIGTIASMAGSYFLEEILWYFGVDIDGRLLGATILLLLLGWVMMVLWIILRFKLNSIRIRFNRRLQGKKTRWPSTMFPAVLMIIFGVFIVIYSILSLVGGVGGTMAIGMVFGGLGSMVGRRVLDFLTILLTAIIYFMFAGLLIKLRREE